MMSPLSDEAVSRGIVCFSSVPRNMKPSESYGQHPNVKYLRLEKRIDEIVV